MKEFSVFIFPQVFYPYFELSIALCCASGLKEMSMNKKLSVVFLHIFFLTVYLCDLALHSAITFKWVIS